MAPTNPPKQQKATAGNKKTGKASTKSRPAGKPSAKAPAKSGASRKASVKSRRRKVRRPTVKKLRNPKMGRMYLNLLKMKTARRPANLTAIELKVAEALVELENNVPELKAELRLCQFEKTRLMKIDGAREALIITIPLKQQDTYRKIQPRLVRELEKKFSDKHVIIVAKREIMPKPHKRASVAAQKRPWTKTCRYVFERILEDLVYPTEIVGKRIHVATNGRKTLKVFLDKKDHTSLAYKLDTFATVYQAYTKRHVEFDFAQVGE